MVVGYVFFKNGEKRKVYMEPPEGKTDTEFLLYYKSICNDQIECPTGDNPIVGYLVTTINSQAVGD